MHRKNWIYAGGVCLSFEHMKCIKRCLYQRVFSLSAIIKKSCFQRVFAAQGPRFVFFNLFESYLFLPTLPRRPPFFVFTFFGGTGSCSFNKQFFHRVKCTSLFVRVSFSTLHVSSNVFFFSFFFIFFFLDYEFIQYHNEKKFSIYVLY